MTLNADEELEHVRSKIEIERKEKASKINASIPHVSELREVAREERRNNSDEEKVTTAPLKMIILISAGFIAVAVMVVMGLIYFVKTLMGL